MSQCTCYIGDENGYATRFDASVEEWSTYTERLGHYFTANKVTEPEQKRAILLAACGPTAYKLIRSLLNVETTSYADIVKLVGKYYNPTPSSIVQRFKFNTRIRAPGKTVSSSVAALRELSEHCKYQDGQLEEMLRDRLVCGVQHDGIQKKLLRRTLHMKRPWS